jgi:hypothetical protein
MILPGKHLKHDRSLIGIGAEILAAIEMQYTVSELWEHVQKNRPVNASPLSYDWFILSLSFLYAIGAIDYEQGLISIGEGL